MKKIIFFIILTSILLLIIVACVLISSSFANIDKATSNDYDVGMLSVLDNDLLNEVTYDKNEETNITIKNGYYDGVRLYIELSGAKNEEELAGIQIIINNMVHSPSHYKNLSNYNDSIYTMADWLLVFDNIKEDISEVFFKGIYKDEIRVIIEGDKADVVKTDIFFEEINLNYLRFGKTSTLIDCDIIADIKGIKFQIETDNEIFPIYAVENETYHYVFVVPTAMNQSAKFNILSYNENGVELRVPIDLSKIKNE